MEYLHHWSSRLWEHQLPKPVTDHNVSLPIQCIFFPLQYSIISRIHSSSLHENISIISHDSSGSLDVLASLPHLPADKALPRHRSCDVTGGCISVCAFIVFVGRGEMVRAKEEGFRCVTCDAGCWSNCVESADVCRVLGGGYGSEEGNDSMEGREARRKGSTEGPRIHMWSLRG